METLFTVEYALKYEGWTLDLCKAPYNWYLVNGMSINVRRNDFYLRLFVYDPCDNLVYSNVIPSIHDYKTKIKKNLIRWKGSKRCNRLLQEQGCSLLLEDGGYILL
jgi:hypothetical protein